MPRFRLLLVPAAVAVVLLTGCQPEPGAPQPTATFGATPIRSVSPTPTSTPTPTPSSTPTQAPIEISCNTISTAQHQADMAANGWTSWEASAERLASGPFSFFPNGSPDGQLICTWGVSPDLATDNTVTLAWAPIDPENSVAARQTLQARGCTVIEAPPSVYVDAGGYPGGLCDAPWGGFYLFTDFDVRWAVTQEELARVTSPDGTG